MLVLKNNISGYLSTVLSFALITGLIAGITSEASADRTKPKCRDVRSATNAVTRAAASVTRYQANLERDRKWLEASKAMCTNPTATPTPNPASCKTSLTPRVPIWESGVCMHYTDLYFTCEKDFNAYQPNGTEVVFKGRNGEQWQITYRVAGAFPPCPEQ